MSNIAHRCISPADAVLGYLRASAIGVVLPPRLDAALAVVFRGRRPRRRKLPLRFMLAARQPMR